MLKKLIVAALAVVLVLSLSACGGCKHEEWDEATCTQARHCLACHIVEGEPLGHDWQEATYEAPETCSRCDAQRGEPLENPAYESDAVLASEAYATVQSYVDYLVGKDRILSYHEDEHVLYFKLTLNDGATEAYAERGDNWGLLTAYLKMMSVTGTYAFSKEGLTIPLHVIVYDDRDGTTVLYEIENGNIISDYYADIVPDFLKTASLETAFNTVYLNCGNDFKITVQYEPTAGIIYFMLAADEATSYLLRYSSAEEMKENKYWLSTTERFTRWSAEFGSNFINEGQDVMCAFFLLDGTDPELAYFAVANGIVIYNYHA
ncbi:MAG: hypothetical protein IKU42_05225 [Oscillospiraceae bacterium]|nr:hypothetical protein [Oscillospiraceae bacterium]